MGGVPKQLLAWLRKLLPRQKVVGDEAIQIGQLQGNAQVHVDKSTHHHHAPVQHQHHVTVMSGVGHGNVQVGSAGGNVVSQHITIIQAPSMAPAAHCADRTGLRPNTPPAGPATQPTSIEQSATLRRMGKLRDRVQVLDFMEREFGTRMVIHLKTEQLFRLNRYLDVVLGESGTTEMPRYRKQPQRVSY